MSSSSSSSSSSHEEAAPAPTQGPVSAEHSTVEPKVDTLERYAGTSFEAHLIDETLQQPKTESTFSVTIVDSDGAEVSDFDLAISGGESVFTATYNGNRAGTYTITVFGDDVQIAQWTVTVNPAPVDPATSTVEPKDEVRDQYQHTPFVVTLLDSHSNPVFANADVVIAGGESFALELSTGNGSEYNFAYTPDVHGDFPITVSSGDIHLASWTVHVNPAPVDAGTSTVDPREETVEIGTEKTFNITLNDSHSKPVSGVEPTVAFEGASFSATVSGADGAFTATYTPDAAGDYPLSVSAGDVHLASWTVHVPAPPEPEPEEKKESSSSSSSSSD